MLVEWWQLGIGYGERRRPCIAGYKDAATREVLGVKTKDIDRTNSKSPVAGTAVQPC
jgi:hypothetical protein